MSPQPLRILVVDDQAAIVWALSSFLKRAGYEVSQAGDAELALAALEHDRPHFVIAGGAIQGSGGVDFCRRIRNLNTPDYVFVFLLVKDSNSNDLIEALQAGVDDFLALPVVHGELLSRLRAGARVLEYERRLARRARTDPLTGLGTRQAFVDALGRQLDSTGRRAASSCVLADIDFFRRVNHRYGYPAGDATLRAVAEHLGVLEDAGDLVCRLGGDRFGVLLTGASESDAESWAENCRFALAELKIPSCDSPAGLTASFGVAQLLPGTTPEAAIALAEQPLLVAKQSGRNRVVASGGMAAITADRAGAGLSSDPLRTAVARDVMTSTVIAVHERETFESAAQLLSDCRLATLPVVDADGMLLGTVRKADLGGRPTERKFSSRAIAEAVSTEAPCYDEETTVQTLYEFFQREEYDRVEIVHSGRPTGYVTRGSLAALSRPLMFDSFAQHVSNDHDSAALLVADLDEVAQA
ncbi:MAG TPA: diguanylate cyclase [Pirellulales bacterium]|nr:diguanylate cyclase [Pirellulales bacterium]